MRRNKGKDRLLNEAIDRVEAGWELLEALEPLLTLLPDRETIEDLKADAGLGYRKYPLEKGISDKDIMALLNASERLRKLGEAV